MTLAAFLRPEGLLALVVWNFMVLAAVQLTVRLIMAFSLRATFKATLVLTLLCYPVAFVYDLLTGGPSASFASRLEWAPVPMLLMALCGFGIARWVMRFKRTRGQVAAAGMVALLAPHLFTLIPL